MPLDPETAPQGASSVRPAPRAGRAGAAVLLAVMLLELLSRATGWHAAQAASWLALGATVLVAWRRLGRREIYLLTLCVLLTVALLRLHPEPGRVLALALDQAAFLMAFILLLGLLYEAAGTSPAVAECGQYLTRQPPGRRYAALYTGTGLMAVLFNVGVVTFLVPLIQRGIAAGTPGDALNPIRERRQLSALLRGFGWSVIWSPTAMAPLALLELIPGIERERWIVEGFAVFLLLLAVGAAEDRIRFRRYKPRAPRVAAPVPTGAVLRFVAACAWLLGLTYILMRLSGDTLVFGLMLACPLMMVGWLWLQNRGRPAALAGRLREISLVELPKSGPVAITLAASGFIGRGAAALVPAAWLADTLGLNAMPDFLLLSAIPPLIGLMSLLGLSPIMTAVFFGSIFGRLPELPADPTLIAMSISCGWAMSMTFSPFATVVLLINRVGGNRTTEVTWGWNTAFTLLTAVTLVPVFAVLTSFG